MDKEIKEIEDPKEEFFPPVVAGANFTIYIGGLAALHRTTKTTESNFWQAAFLEEIPDHTLKARLFIYENGTMSGKPHDMISSGNRHTISFDLVSEASTSVPADHVSAAHTSITRIGDFSGTELHGDSVGAKAVKLARRAKAISKLSLNTGTGYTALLATGGDQKHDLYCFSKAGNVVRELGHWFAIDNQGRNGSKLTIKVDESEWVPSTVPLEFKAGREYKLVIDNMCWMNHCASENDFPYYYVSNHFGSGFEGIIDEEANDLILVKSNKDRVQQESDLKMLNYRVACNVMRVSDIAGGNDLFTALGI